ncbi:MAG: hypothetical protein H6837_01840 [Planctomycetes bacterium]|nr:hypothetical protein [Planctomycetota bacterium]
MQADTAMRLSEIRRLEQGQPFRPFRICLSDGSAHEVRDPNLLFLTQHTVIVSRREADEDIPKHTVYFDPVHITRVEIVLDEGG